LLPKANTLGAKETNNKFGANKVPSVRARLPHQIPFCMRRPCVFTRPNANTTSRAHKYTIFALRADVAGRNKITNAAHKKRQFEDRAPSNTATRLKLQIELLHTMSIHLLCSFSALANPHVTTAKWSRREGTPWSLL
jgi:hypothetical protein